MARKPRLDGPDTWHHVMNRAIARRTLFETDADRRYFLSLLAQQVRAGRLEVHAFSLLLTHFHLLVRSVKGELSEALRQIQYRYSRRFNRTRRRDGSLFRGRLLSCPIHDLVYRRNVLTYIHDNPVAAGVAAHPHHHAWSSACHLARADRPAWLATDWVETELEARGKGETVAEQLASAFPSRIEEDFRSWVEKRLSERYFVEEEDVSLRYAGSPKVVRWTIRKARLADGTRPWQPVSSPGLVERLVDKSCAGAYQAQARLASSRSARVIQLPIVHHTQQPQTARQDHLTRYLLESSRVPRNSTNSYRCGCSRHEKPRNSSLVPGIP